MNFFSLLATAVLAAETVVLSPLPDNFSPPTPLTTPAVSFGSLSHFVPQVLGATTETTPTPTPPPRKTRQRKYTIALLGDSMIDTLGPDFPALQTELAKIFPKVKFEVLNYGVGGTNIDLGLTRLTNDYLYQGRVMPPLVSQNPDLVIVESFGYNPYSFEEGSLSRHWLALAQIMDVLKSRLPNTKIIIAATIAPSTQVFGMGAPNLNYDETGRRQKVTTIKKYLENAVRFAQSQKLPLADAYHPSLDAEGSGRAEFINPGDHIHYSDRGRQFFAQKLVETIVTRKLLE